jgi:hypothetical protein
MILKSSSKLILLFEVAVESLDLHVVVLKSPWVRELMQRESGYVACEQRCSWKSILTILPAMYVALTGSSRTGSHPEQMPWARLLVSFQEISKHIFPARSRTIMHSTSSGNLTSNVDESGR